MQREDTDTKFHKMDDELEEDAAQEDDEVSSEDLENTDKIKLTEQDVENIKKSHHRKKKVILILVYSIFIMTWFGLFVSIMETNDPENFTIHGSTLYVRAAISFGFFCITPALFWMYETIFLHLGKHYMIEKSVLLFDVLISVLLYGQYYRYTQRNNPDIPQFKLITEIWWYYIGYWVFALISVTLLSFNYSNHIRYFTLKVDNPVEVDFGDLLTLGGHVERKRKIY